MESLALETLAKKNIPRIRVLYETNLESCQSEILSPLTLTAQHYY